MTIYDINFAVVKSLLSAVCLKSFFPAVTKADLSEHWVLSVILFSISLNDVRR